MTPIALVTGASAGLGVEFARQLSKRGHRLILAARRKERLEELAAELGNARAVAIDLSGLSYLDSAGLALLSRLAGRLSELSGSLRLVVPPDAFVGRTLSISGLASAIPVDETVEAALAALARG